MKKSVNITIKSWFRSTLASILFNAKAKKIIDNAKWLTLFAMFGRASWLITLLLLGRAMGPTMFGTFSVYLAFWLIIGRIFGLGLEVWVNKRIASSASGTIQLQSAAIAEQLRALFVGTGISLILMASCFAPKTIAIVFPVFTLLAFRQFCESLREVQVGILQGREQMRAQTLALIPWDLVQLVLVAICVALVSSVNSLYFLVLILAITSLGKTVTLSLIIRKNTKAWPKYGDIKYDKYRDAVAESFLFGLGMLVALGLGKFDVLLLKSFAKPEVVGNYSMAYLFLEVCTIVLGILRQSIFPSLASYASNAKDIFLRLTCVASLSFFLAGLAGAVLLSFLGPFFLQLSGHSFTDAPHILKLLACALPWVALSSSLGNAINAGGLAKKGVVAQGTGLTINIFANLFWIPQYSSAGAAYATLLAYAVTALGYAYILQTYKRRYV